MKTKTSDSELLTPKLRIFNPSRLSDAELEASFIVHCELFEKLLNRITNEKKGHVPQHHLIVGQRGMGKTTLLCRIAVELRKPEYCKQYVPLQFPEEQYIEIDRLSKFWLSCLDSLADALDEEGDLVAAKDLDAKIHSLDFVNTNEDDVSRKAKKLFETTTQSIQRRPVLLFDNFHHLLERLKEDDYALRAFFMREDAPILIAASTIIPGDTNDYGAAFYDAFMIHLLHRLSLQEMQNVLKQLAENSDNARLAARIQNEVPRLATLRDLTGGNPRTTALLFELFSQGFSKDAYDDLESLLDHMTPLYQSRLDQLSEQSQLVLGTLARNWSPASAQQLTELTNLPRGSISTQLNRLEAIGMVEKVELSKGKKPGYQVTERFFNIWYLMRFSARRQRNSLIFLTRFLQEFYTPAELHKRARDLITKGQLSKGEQVYAAALSETGLDTTTAYKLYTRADDAFSVHEGSGRLKRIDPITDRLSVSDGGYSFEETKRKLRERVIESGAKIDPDDFVDVVMGSILFLPPDKPNRLDLIEKKLEAKEVELLYEQAKGHSKWIAKSPTETWIEERLRRGLITRLDNTKQIQNALEATDDPMVCLIFAEWNWGHNNFELATKAYESALELGLTKDYLYHKLVFLYRDFKNNAEKAHAYFDLTIKGKTNEHFSGLEELQKALFASCEQNWGQAQQYLANALNLTGEKSPLINYSDFDWISSVLLHQGYGVKLSKFLDEEGWSIRLMPWVEAIRAHSLEDRRHLLDIPQESREVADSIYDRIAQIRKHLPESTRNLFTK